MKVHELIEALKSMPQDAEVLHLWDGALRTSIELVYLSRSGYVVTSDYSMVCYDGDSRPKEAPTELEDRYWQTIDNPNPDEYENYD